MKLRANVALGKTETSVFKVERKLPQVVIDRHYGGCFCGGKRRRSRMCGNLAQASDGGRSAARLPSNHDHASAGVFEMSLNRDIMTF